MLLEEEQLETWEEVMDRLRQEIPLMDPDWTNHNIQDPGITLLELFAWLRQAQMYHASRIGPHHLKKYIGILGVSPTVRSPGHTFVTVESAQGRYLEPGFRFYADEICFETREAQMVVEDLFLGFEMTEGEQSHLIAGEWASQGRNISLLPFGKRPGPGNCFIIHFASPLKEQLPYRIFLEIAYDIPVKPHPMEEKAFDGYGFYPLAQIRMEYSTGQGFREAKVMGDDTWGMIQDGSVRFCLPEPMGGEDLQIRFVLERSGYLLAPRITRISMAMVEVWQQETRTAFAGWRGSGLPDQQYELEDKRIDAEKTVVMAEEDLTPGQMTEWIRVNDFDRSGPEDRHYMLEDGILTFGDGFHGRMPEGRIEIARLVLTLGEAGNIKAGTITKAAADPSLTVTNERDVTGGTDQETPEETLRRAAAEKIRRKRAVTEADYEELISGIPGLLIEDCKAYLLHPEKREICIAVKPYTADGSGCLNEAYRINLCRYLEEKRLIGTRLVFVSPEYIGLEITCAVTAKIQYRNAAKLVEREIAGWIGKKKFGEAVCYGQLRGFIDTLPCVRNVESLILDTGSQGRRNRQGDILLPPGGLIRLKRVVCSLTKE